MFGFQYDGQELNHELVAAVAQLLDKASVFNLLWGDYALRFLGVPAVTDGIAFIIPDARVSTAYSALFDAGFHPCTKGSSCTVTTGLRGPPPTARLHLNDHRPLSIYRNSDILWTFPSFESTFSDPNYRNSLLASFFDPQLYPFRFLTASRYTESTILFLARHRGSHAESWLMARLSYIMEYVEGTSLFKEQDLQLDCREYYRALKLGDPEMFSVLDRLRG
ncbi:hypothetical protein ACJ73_03897 [Blastomyces percursus]|uniref:Uncharacterized protein n=1 Tax=Blastomyces percursus TaxID=1658174 RepID=A0A1J9Q7J6_9EURO|nr:hypothetical protein ACJ73_03897 [Blastomyces percursus]